MLSFFIAVLGYIVILSYVFRQKLYDKGRIGMVWVYRQVHFAHGTMWLPIGFATYTTGKHAGWWVAAYAWYGLAAVICVYCVGALIRKIKQQREGLPTR